MEQMKGDHRKKYGCSTIPLLGSHKVSFAKEPYKRDNILQKRPIEFPNCGCSTLPPFAMKAELSSHKLFLHLELSSHKVSFAKEPYKRDNILQKIPIEFPNCGCSALPPFGPGIHVPGNQDCSYSTVP